MSSHAPTARNSLIMSAPSQLDAPEGPGLHKHASSLQPFGPFRTGLEVQARIPAQAREVLVVVHRLVREQTIPVEPGRGLPSFWK